MGDTSNPCSFGTILDNPPLVVEEIQRVQGGVICLCDGLISLRGADKGIPVWYLRRGKNSALAAGQGAGGGWA